MGINDLNKDANSPMDKTSIFSRHDDTVRRGMSITHLTQAVPVVNGEINNINSVYGQILHSGSTFETAVNDTKVLRSFELFEHKIQVIIDLETKIIDIIFLDEDKNGFFTESKVATGIVPPMGTIVENETTERLYSIGVNALTATFLAKGTFEDAMIISEDFAKKMSHNVIKEYIIPIGVNTELVNLSGTSEYEPVLKHTEEDIAVLRKRSDVNFMSFTIDALNKPDVLRDTKRFKGKGDNTVKVYIGPKTEIPVSRTWKWLKERHDETVALHVEFLEYIKMIEETMEAKTSKLLHNLCDYYTSFAKETMSIYNKQYIEGAILKIKSVNKNVNAVDGSKITTMHGTKGLVTVKSNKDMPTLEDGTIIDVCINVDTMVGRMGLGTIREIQFNHITKSIDSKIKNSSVEEGVTLLNDYFKMCGIPRLNFEEASAVVSHPNFTLFGIVDTISDSDIDKYVENCKRNVLVDGKLLESPVTVGYNYMYKLKHEPNKKSSAVALPYENDKGQVIRSAKKDYLKLNDQPSRYGTMETSHLLMADKVILDELITLRSDSKQGRELLATQLIRSEDPDNINIGYINAKDNVNVNFFESMLVSLGVQL